jgi:hypothetical protein
MPQLNSKQRKKKKKWGKHNCLQDEVCGLNDFDNKNNVNTTTYDIPPRDIGEASTNNRCVKR